MRKVANFICATVAVEFPSAFSSQNSWLAAEFCYRNGWLGCTGDAKRPPPVKEGAAYFTQTVKPSKSINP